MSPQYNVRAVETLISISGTLASIGLALVAILTAKTSIDHEETFADDFFLMSSLGFLFVVVPGYLIQKSESRLAGGKLVGVAEGCFSLALLGTVSGAFLMVYTVV